jgi:hypothetical protein
MGHASTIETTLRALGKKFGEQVTIEIDMGQEANCKARFGKQVSAGRAMLETDYVLFRGDFRVKIPSSRCAKVRRPAIG